MMTNTALKEQILQVFKTYTQEKHPQDTIDYVNRLLIEFCKEEYDAQSILIASVLDESIYSLIHYVRFSSLTRYTTTSKTLSTQLKPLLLNYCEDLKKSAKITDQVVGTVCGYLLEPHFFQTLDMEENARHFLVMFNKLVKSASLNQDRSYDKIEIASFILLGITGGGWLEGSATLGGVLLAIVNKTIQQIESSQNYSILQEIFLEVSSYLLAPRFFDQNQVHVASSWIQFYQGVRNEIEKNKAYFAARENLELLVIVRLTPYLADKKGFQSSTLKIALRDLVMDKMGSLFESYRNRKMHAREIALLFACKYICKPHLSMSEKGEQKALSYIAKKFVSLSVRATNMVDIYMETNKFMQEILNDIKCFLVNSPLGKSKKLREKMYEFLLYITEISKDQIDARINEGFKFEDYFSEQYRDNLNGLSKEMLAGLTLISDYIANDALEFKLYSGKKLVELLWKPKHKDLEDQRLLNERTEDSLAEWWEINAAPGFSRSNQN